ncbi:alpha/beta hydrolase [Luteibacter jiangsuensis]|uniref:Alpha/beta hydrolase n=1 Tax=Luteibacter jiangsuensis TaxID=637577 RepID=A0ABX0Q5H2_9GAMM|nr:alpha/beta hydrolase [Luteibacter jiangsuensis]NID04937.1 alpha/beta hydrolase [Luteibacter jiangsuensis]
MTTTKDSKRGVAIPAHTVPFPSSISVEARTALERLVGEDGSVLNAAFVTPGPDDHEGWLRMKAAVGGQYANALKGLAGRTQSTVETIATGAATVHVATPVALKASNGAYIDFHGGALVFGGGEACRTGAQMQADQHGVLCYGVDYRMPPEHPFPAAVEDGVSAYRHALERHGPENIVVGGRSAGGNIAVATLLKARDEGLPLPAGLVLLSPQVDLTESGDSFATHQLIDVVLPGSLRSSNLLYANGADLTQPYVSPLFADLTGFPPTFLQSGTRDLFLSNTVRMHRALRRAGVPAELHVFEAMPHGGFGGATPEDRELQQEIVRFVEHRWAD